MLPRLFNTETDQFMMAKNEASLKDAEHHKKVERNHKDIMNKDNKGEYKLDKPLSYKVLKRRGKGCLIS